MIHLLVLCVQVGLQVFRCLDAQQLKALLAREQLTDDLHVMVGHPARRDGGQKAQLLPIH
jgi:hypothetical protein